MDKPKGFFLYVFCIFVFLYHFFLRCITCEVVRVVVRNIQITFSNPCLYANGNEKEFRLKFRFSL